MEIDPSQEEDDTIPNPIPNALQTLTTGPLPSSISKLSVSSTALPSDKDFHFYYNFDQFKSPVKQITQHSDFLLNAVGGASSQLWGEQVALPQDLDDAYNWLVNLNDEVYERLDVSVGEFRDLWKKEEESGVRLISSEVSGGLENDGFQLVYGKKMKKNKGWVGGQVVLEKGSAQVKVVSRDKKAVIGGNKPKIPFHIPTIPRPQDHFKIIVDNSNKPFEHVWLQKNEDGSGFIHPLEKLSVLDFVDNNVGEVEPVKPPPVECTPFKFVSEVKDLKELAAKLHGIDEFAVDLEHNQYRSFQGLTCLMQISTRTEDFILDTLKLRIHIGPYLREVFKDPAKKKVMHGADRDIIWLQRDFGIYVCNLFDTGQASRVMQLERYSLEFLLQHFCGVTANKEYQNADWRLRPLPIEMLRYAREDTHYLLYIYDVMRIRLLSYSTDSESSDGPLVEVYKRSYDICMQLYEKELLTDSSYLQIYGLQGVDLNAQQLAVVAGLCEWRDAVARAEDESTGYILPNKTLTEIAKQMPVTTSKLRWLVKLKHSYAENNLSSVVSIIRHSIQNAAAFEAAAKHLKERRMEMASRENVMATDERKALKPPETPATIKNALVTERIGNSSAPNDRLLEHSPEYVQIKGRSSELGGSTTEVSRIQQKGSSEHFGENGSETSGHVAHLQRDSFIISGKIMETDSDMNVSHVTGATVQVLKKPSRAFGALLGNAASKRKFHPDKKEKQEIKLEQIRSSVNLPFESFLGRAEQMQPVVKETAYQLEVSHNEEPVALPAKSSNLEEVIILESDSDLEESVGGDSESLQAKGSNLEEVILLDSDSDLEESVRGDSEAALDQLQHEDDAASSALDLDGADELMSLSDLSSSFEKCLQSSNQTRKAKQIEKPQECEGLLQLKPFDYEAARKQVRLGGDSGEKLRIESDELGRSGLDTRDGKKSSNIGPSPKDEGGIDFPQGRRRQAFPASGNRSIMFR